MAEREQIRKTPERRSEETATEDVETSEAATERADKLKSDLDGLLDEIDEVLEDNAEEFVRNYVQKGGE
jgi:ubiquitin-like protein Pup